MLLLTMAMSRCPIKCYLLCDLVISHIYAGGDWPLDVQAVFV